MGMGGLAELVGLDTTDLNKTKISMNKRCKNLKKTLNNLTQLNNKVLKSLDGLL